MSGNSGPGWQKHPEHRIALKASDRRVQALIDGQVIADSTAALTLEESGHPAVVYFPRADVRMDRLTHSTHRSHCPFKGDASYYSAVDGAQNVAWSYEEPYDEVSGIRSRVAFYPEHAEIRRL